jgi:hypothetical protein
MSQLQNYFLNISGLVICEDAWISVDGVFDSSVFKWLSQHSYGGAEEREPFHDNQSPSFSPDRGKSKKKNH